MATRFPARTLLASVLALVVMIGFSAAFTRASSQRDALPGDYQRVILISWDGVHRAVLQELLEITDPNSPCWEGGDRFPLATGRFGTQGEPLYTCLPALAGVKPTGMPDDSPSYGPFQVIASHTTDDGQTMTKPQHASMLTGYNTEAHGITGNVSSVRMPEGLTIYERLMDAFDPVSPEGQRDGFILRTQHSADQKFIGASVYYWAKISRALQVKSGHGSEIPGKLGALKYAQKSFARWNEDAQARGFGAPSFFMFLHFKSTDWAGHLGGERSKGYRQAIVATDERLYLLMETLRAYGWDDTAILITTDHGFSNNTHGRNSGRTVFNTWLAARNVHLSTDQIPMRTPEDYCASHEDPADCLANGPAVPMPPQDVVPNVNVTDVVPTILDMFGVEWRSTTQITGESLYRP